MSAVVSVTCSFRYYSECQLSTRCCFSLLSQSVQISRTFEMRQRQFCPQWQATKRPSIQMELRTREWTKRSAEHHAVASQVLSKRKFQTGACAEKALILCGSGSLCCANPTSRCRRWSGSFGDPVGAQGVDQFGLGHVGPARDVTLLRLVIQRVPGAIFVRACGRVDVVSGLRVRDTRAKSLA